MSPSACVYTILNFISDIAEAEAKRTHYTNNI